MHGCPGATPALWCGRRARSALPAINGVGKQTRARTMSERADVFDRVLFQRHRTRWAGEAAARDFLVDHAAQDLMSRLAMINRTFAVTLSLGAHAGTLGRHLRRSPRMGTVVESESCAALLAQCDGPRICADEELLPYKDASLDAVVSALALHAVNDLPGTLLQVRRALKPDGLLLAALLGGDTLHELREAFLLAETEITGGAGPRVAPFADVRTLGALLQRAGFALPVADSDVTTVTYETPMALMSEVRAMGCANALVERSRRALRRDVLARACQVYAERHAVAGGRIRATFEIVTLTAWAPDDSQQQPLRPGSATTRLADVLGVRERPADAGTGKEE